MREGVEKNDRLGEREWEAGLGFSERREDGGKGSESSLGASGVRHKEQGELGCWREEWRKQRNGKQREVPRRNPRFMSHQLGPRESSGLCQGPGGKTG